MSGIKKILYILALVLIGASIGFGVNFLLMPHASAPPNTKEPVLSTTPQTHRGFGLYLTENDRYIVGDNEVESFAVTTGEIKLTAEGRALFAQINGRTGLGKLHGKQFAIRLDEAIVQEGTFWSAASSQFVPGFILQPDLIPFTGSFSIKNNIILEPGDTSSENPTSDLLEKHFRSIGKPLTASPIDTAAYENAYAAFYADQRAQKTVNSSTIGIQFFGDMMLDRNVAKVMGDKGLTYLFEHFHGSRHGLNPAIDLTVANLEGPFAPTRVPTSKSIAFRFDPKLARELSDYGFDVVSLANNHTLDMGWKNVPFTEQTLENAGIGHFGNQLEERVDLTYVTSTPFSADKIAFVGLNNTDHSFDLQKIAAILKDARTRARYVFVMMHWGIEYERISSAAQRDFAHFLIDNGADAVIGAHPHVVQEMEFYQGKPIFYSLGNFLFDQYFSTETQEGLSLGMILQDGTIKSIYAFPFYSRKSQVFLMEDKRRDDFYDWLNKNSRLSGAQFIGGKITAP